MKIVLGVDAGSSKTHALLLDESGRVLGFGIGGGGNHQSHGLAVALVEIEKAVKLAIGDYPLPLESACFCLAGADLNEDYSMLQDAMEKLNVARSVLVKNDTFAAMRAGLTHHWGVVVICGSGLMRLSVPRTDENSSYPGLDRCLGIGAEEVHLLRK